MSGPQQAGRGVGHAIRPYARLTSYHRVTPAMEQRQLARDRQTALREGWPAVYARARRMAARALPRAVGSGCGCTLDSLCVDAARAHIVAMEPGTPAYFAQLARDEYAGHRAPFGGRVTFNAATLEMAWRDLWQCRQSPA